MADILAYRIPRSEVKEFVGDFYVIEDPESYEGFIVGDFNLSKVFGFHPKSEPSEIHFNKERPREYSEEQYKKLAVRFIQETQTGELSKVILSRVEKVSGEWDPVEVFNELEKLYPNAFVYMISSKEFGTWIGATPEVVLKGEKDSFKTVALAGTKLKNDDSPWRKKEVEEQLYVSDFIEQTIADVDQRAEIRKSGPAEKVSGPVKHLNTDFEFKSKESAWKIIRALHPSPAVSGIPKEKAVEFIHDNEMHDRSLYTGVIGVIGGDTNLFVNLRCMQLLEDEACLYVGGGITEYSDADEEWQETKNKALTLISVLENR